MELIVNSKWKTICDLEFSKDNPELPPDRSVVFCHMDNIYPFFKTIEGTDRRYTLVSADSDYCLVRQQEHPVWRDMQKWLNFIPIEESLGYDPVVLPSRCDTRFCKIDDTYSIKMYSFTKATFDKIPENIDGWFVTNCDLDMPGIIHIPFGIPEWNVEKIERGRSLGLHTSSNKKPITYVNFQSNTMERVHLKSRYTHQKDFFVEYTEIPHQDFIDKLFSSQFVLSPPGNGFDCFRTLEAIYCGATPIALYSKWNKVYEGVGACLVGDLFNYQQTRLMCNELENTPVDFGYWRQRISEFAEIVRKDR
jgi:hypothetical protein